MTEAANSMPMRLCTIAGCGRPSRKSSMCAAHASRKTRGTPMDAPVRRRAAVALSPVGFWEKVDIRGPDECWPWTASLREGGYGQVRWGRIVTSAHRVAWILTNGPIPDDLWVLHSCDNPPCCNPGHHFLGDVVINNADRDAKGRGRHLRGEEAGGAKLTAVQVLEIRAKLAARVRGRVLAKEYGISEPTITQIKHRTIWAHL